MHDHPGHAVASFTQVTDAADFWNPTGHHEQTEQTGQTGAPHINGDQTRDEARCLSPPRHTDRLIDRVVDDIRGSAHPVYTPDQATAETLENTSYLVPPAPPLPGCKQDPIPEKPTPAQHRNTQQNSLCDPHSNPLPAIYHPYTALSIGQ